ncbi:MAG: ribosome-associated translation inhibitor RaiA [Patescibacteria group bacterium]
MKITSIKGSNIELTQAIKKYATDKISSLDKFLKDFGPSVQADIEVCKETHKHQKGMHFHCSVIMPIPGEVLHAEEKAEDLYEAIDKVKDKLQRQITDIKAKLTDKKVKGKRPGKDD